MVNQISFICLSYNFKRKIVFKLNKHEATLSHTFWINWIQNFEESTRFEVGLEMKLLFSKTSSL